MKISTKEKLLLAANRVVQKEGVHKLTLAAVAAEAEMSKGALLYHFATKDALLSAMVQYLLSSFTNAIDSKEAHHSNPHIRLKAYIDASINHSTSQIQSSGGLLAAVANDMSLLEPLREQYRQWDSEMHMLSAEDNLLPKIIRLAADGIWFNELFGLTKFSDEDKKALFDEFRRRLDDEA